MPHSLLNVIQNLASGSLTDGGLCLEMLGVVAPWSRLDQTAVFETVLASGTKKCSSHDFSLLTKKCLLPNLEKLCALPVCMLCMHSNYAKTKFDYSCNNPSSEIHNQT